MDEKLRILKMVEEGTVTAEQAAELMSAMNIDAPAQQSALEKGSYDKKMFRIKADQPSGDKVNIQLPIGAVKKILKATGKLPVPESSLDGLDISSIMEGVMECLDEEMEGDIVNVSEPGGAVVRIFIDK